MSKEKYGTFLFEFTSHGHWVNRAQALFEDCGVGSMHTVCVDSKDRICRMGTDFMIARDEGTFPIKVYLYRDHLNDNYRIAILKRDAQGSRHRN